MSFSILYSVITYTALPFGLLYHWYRSISRGRKSAFKERLGFLSPAVSQIFSGRQVVWLHAVSVGEVIAARTLLRGLKRSYPQHRLLLSVTTETGRAVAEKDNLADSVIYFPFDVSFAVSRLLDAVKPRAIIIMETEIWPIFTREAERRGIALFLANGRISERSFPRYRRFSWFFKPVLEKFSGLGMQTKADLERIRSIGAPKEKSRELGNLKYDIPYSPVNQDERLHLRESYHIPGELTVLVAGSTHQGEENLLLEVYSRLLETFPNLLLILVPRHPERVSEVDTLIRRAGLPAVYRSQLDQMAVPCHAAMVLLVDTVGEMMSLYALSDIAYVGGSLVPTGGHNLLEPASRGIPMLFGPHMENFREISDLVLDYGAGVQVASQEELQDSVRDFLISPELRQVIGVNGLKLMRDNGGAVERHLGMVAEALAQ